MESIQSDSVQGQMGFWSSSRPGKSTCVWVCVCVWQGLSWAAWICCWSLSIFKLKCIAPSQCIDSYPAMSIQSPAIFPITYKDLPARHKFITSLWVYSPLSLSLPFSRFLPLFPCHDFYSVLEYFIWTGFFCVSVWCVLTICKEQRGYFLWNTGRYRLYPTVDWPEGETTYLITMK